MFGLRIRERSIDIWRGENTEKELMGIPSTGQRNRQTDRQQGQRQSESLDIKKGEK